MRPPTVGVSLAGSWAQPEALKAWMIGLPAVRIIATFISRAMA